MNKNNNVPLFEEQRIFQEEHNDNEIQEILNRFKQPIPKGFIKLKTEGENYMRSTPSSWPKSVCERYNFVVEEDWITLDIPHSLLEKLELEKGQEITYPIYLSPEVLQRKEVCKGITLENETEIFLDKPLTIKSLEKSLTAWTKEINHLEEKVKRLEQENQKNSKLKEEKDNLEIEIKNLKDWKNMLNLI